MVLYKWFRVEVYIGDYDCVIDIAIWQYNLQWNLCVMDNLQSLTSALKVA